MRATAKSEAATPTNPSSPSRSFWAITRSPAMRTRIVAVSTSSGKMYGRLSVVLIDVTPARSEIRRHDAVQLIQRRLHQVENGHRVDAEHDDDRRQRHQREE